MKKILFTVTLIIYSTFGFSQFIKHYEIANEQNVHFDCITASGQGFIIAGSLLNPATNFNTIYVARVNTLGNIVNNWQLILTGYTNDIIVPRAVSHNIITNELIIAGHIGADLNTSHAFILSYDLNLLAMNWISIITDRFSSFLDMERGNDDDFIVCGQIDDGIPDSDPGNGVFDLGTYFDACVYSVDHTTGVMTPRLIQSTLATQTTDTYFALTELDDNDNSGLAGRFEVMNSDHSRRASLTTADIYGSGLTITDNFNYYLSTASGMARHYNLDVQRRGNQYWSIIMGDLNSTETLFDELFVLRTDGSGSIQLLEQLDLLSGLDGNLHSLKVTQPGPHSLNVIAYGSTDDNDDGDLDRAMLVNLNGNGSVNWAQAFDNIFSDNPSCANSMIISGSDIYAVGWFLDGEQELGALLKFPVAGGSLLNSETLMSCQDDLSVTPINKSTSNSPNLLNNTHDPVIDNPTINFGIPTAWPIDACFNNIRLAQYPVSEIVYTQQFAEQVMISVQNMETDAEYSIFVYDILGNLITHQQIDNSITINQQLSSGMYFYVLNKNNQKILADNFFVN